MSLICFQQTTSLDAYTLDSFVFLFVSSWDYPKVVPHMSSKVIENTTPFELLLFVEGGGPYARAPPNAKLPLPTTDNSFEILAIGPNDRLLSLCRGDATTSIDLHAWSGDIMKRWRAARIISRAFIGPIRRELRRKHQGACMIQALLRGVLGRKREPCGICSRRDTFF